MNCKRRPTLLAAALFCGLVLAANAEAQDRPSLTVGRYRLQSNPWVNLHQRLLYEAVFKADRPPAGLSADGLAKWTKAVDDYRAYVGRRNPIFDDELVLINDALAATTAD